MCSYVFFGNPRDDPSRLQGSLSAVTPGGHIRCVSNSLSMNISFQAMAAARYKTSKIVPCCEESKVNHIGK